MDPSGIEAIWAKAPALMLVLTRVGALFVAAPLFGGPFSPARVRLFLALGLALILLPVVRLPDPIPQGAGFILLLVQEVAVGLSMGFLMTIFTEGVRAGGELINRYAGLSAAENFDPELGLGEGPVGDLLHIGFILLFFATEAHHQVLATLVRSFEAVPVGAWTFRPGMLELTAQATGQSMVIACGIAFPVLAATLLITMTEGVLARAVPQINVLFMSFAVKIGVSFLVLWASLPAVVAFMGGVLVLMQKTLVAALPQMR